MKNYLKFGLFLVGLSLLLWQCQKDNFIETTQTEIAESIFKTNTVKLSEIPDVKDFLTTKSKTNIFNQKTIIEGAIFDVDNIMEVIDTLNRTNYSFRFTYPSTPKGVYYNLVVGKSPEGVLKAPYVLKYVTDDAHTDAFIENNYDFRFFKGTVGLHKFTDYFQQGGAFKTNADTYCPPEYDAFGDPIACDNINLDGSGVGTGGGGSGSDGGIAPSGDGTTSGGGVYTGIDSGSGSCTWTVSYEPCGAGGNADGHGPSGGIGCEGSPTILTLDCPGMYKMSQTNTALKTSTTSTDCPSCPTGGDGGVGVNFGDQIINNLTNLCAKQIFTELENGIFTQDPLKPEITIPNESIHLNFSQSILKLFNDSQKFNYVVTNGNTTGSNASTAFPSLNPISNSWDITTTISDTYLSTATRLSIARTMIHESVHAYLLYEQRNYPSSLYTSLVLYGKANGYNTSNRLHHEFMSQYINAMAYSLYEWDKTYGTGGNLGWNYYKSMAFAGLYYYDSNNNLVETDSFKALIPDAKDRLEIRNIIINEQDGNSNAQGGNCN